MKSIILSLVLATALCKQEQTSPVENFVHNGLRPFMRHAEQFHVGFSKSFRNVNPEDPFYCLHGGKEALFAFIDIVKPMLYDGIFDADIFYSATDPLQSFLTNCNPLQFGQVSLLLLNQHQNVFQFLTTTRLGKSVFAQIGFYTYFIVAFAYDINVMYSSYMFNFISHFDYQSAGFLFGRFTNSFLNFVTLYIYFMA